MIKLLVFCFSYIAVWVRVLTPGGARVVAAENIALRKQLISLSRHIKRSPKLSVYDRIIFGFLGTMMSVKRLSRIAIILKPATLLKFHKALVKRKYQLLFTAKNKRKPGPRGPSQDIIDAVIEMKRRNMRYGYRRIAMQMTIAFGVDIDKDVVRRILNKYFKYNPKNSGPSWLTFIGNMKDSLWSIDLFCCESIHLKIHWVMVIMDHYSRRIIGFSVHQGYISGIDLCCIFNTIISGKHLPKYLSSDCDPLFTYHQWQANLRILEIEGIKSIPYTPTSHPFIERLIGTVRRELLDHTLFWNERDLQNKLNAFQCYYNESRGHCGIDGISPAEKSGEGAPKVVSLENYRWEKHCRGLYQLPAAA